MWSLADVAPGGVERCAAAYGAAVDLGDAVLPHRALGREALHVQRATGLADGRLGAGRAVGGVRAAGLAWTDAPADRLWAEPLAAQLDRAWASQERDPTERRARGDMHRFSASKRQEAEGPPGLDA